MNIFMFVLITVCVTHTYSKCEAFPHYISDETNMQANNNISNEIRKYELQDNFIDDVQKDGAVDNYYNTSVVDAKNVTVCGNITCSDNGRGCESYGVCRCLVGSWGDACDQDRDECRATSSPCGRRAHCINTPGSFECVCLEGWTGEHCVIRNTSVALECLPGWTGNMCDEDIDECANSSDVCLGEHYTCRNYKGGFMCRCVSGWKGVNCSEDIDECLRYPCQHFATCSNLPGSYKCHCTASYTGSNCQTDIDECTSNPCLNSGTCTNSVGSFSCSCPLGWSGVVCQADLDECKNDPCLHSGNCINRPGNFSCICENSWTGSLCQNDVDECLISPCHNEGTCVNNNGSFSCLCPSSWQGQTCSDDVDECRRKSCGVNELCTNTHGSFTCSCPIGFQGLNCTEDVDECIGKPCLNKGTCVNTNGSFFCVCSDEQRGDLCEHLPNDRNVKCYLGLAEVPCDDSFFNCKVTWNFLNPCTHANILAGNLRFPHPYDSKKFLMCDLSGKVYVVLCPNGEIFKADCSQCIGENVTGTLDCNNPLTTGVTNPCTRENILAGNVYFKYPGDASKYIKCDVWGHPWERNCQAGMDWSQDLQTCFIPSTVNPCLHHQPGQPYLFPHHCDPHLYIHCDTNHHSYEQSCQLDFVFLASVQVCVPPGSYPGTENLVNTCYGASTQNHQPGLPSTVYYQTTKRPVQSYGYSTQPYAEPCTLANILANELYFAYKDNNRNYIECDLYGHAFLRDCSPKYYDPYSHTCVDDNQLGSPFVGK